MPPRVNAAAKAAANPAATATDQQPETLGEVLNILAKLSSQFTTFGARLDAVDGMRAQLTGLEAKFAAMEAKLVIQLEENKLLKADLSLKTKAMEDMLTNNSFLEAKCNELEQYNRSWSVRIQNIPLTEEEEKSPAKTRDKVYNLALLPILAGAKERGDISIIPEADQLLEVAHVLAGKPGENKPVIARFYNRIDKALCLRLKRDFAPRKARQAATGRKEASGGDPGPGTRQEERGWFAYPFTEDLTRLNFTKMRAISRDPKVHACWSINGALRFRLVDSNVVKKVHSVFDSVESIISK